MNYSYSKLVHIDDQQSILGMVKLAFQGTNVELHSTPDPDAFIEIVKEVCPEVALIDSVLGDVSGETVAKKLYDVNKKTKVVFFSSREENQLFSGEAPKNYVGLVSKKVPLQSVPNKIDEVVRARYTEVSRIPKLDRSHVYQLAKKYRLHLVESVPQLKELWIEFEQKKGGEAMELLIIKIHSITGTSSIYGMTDLAKIAESLESLLLSYRKQQKTTGQPVIIPNTIKFSFDGLIEEICSLLPKS